MNGSDFGRARQGTQERRHWCVAWTADDDWIFEHLIKADVDGIITNYPERLVRFLGAPVDK